MNGHSTCFIHLFMQTKLKIYVLSLLITTPMAWIANMDLKFDIFDPTESQFLCIFMKYDVIFVNALHMYHSFIHTD